MKLKIFHDTRTRLIWAVRIVEQGDKWGLNDSLTHDRPDPLVEFYDTRYEHTDRGQFVNRYNLSTILKSSGGVNLDPDVPDWTVYEDCMDRVRAWVRGMK